MSVACRRRLVVLAVAAVRHGRRRGLVIVLAAVRLGRRRGLVVLTLARFGRGRRGDPVTLVVVLTRAVAGLRGGRVLVLAVALVPALAPTYGIGHRRRLDADRLRVARGRRMRGVGLARIIGLVLVGRLVVVVAVSGKVDPDPLGGVRHRNLCGPRQAVGPRDPTTAVTAAAHATATFPATVPNTVPIIPRLLQFGSPTTCPAAGPWALLAGVTAGSPLSLARPTASSSASRAPARGAEPWPKLARTSPIAAATPPSSGWSVGTLPVSSASAAASSIVG